MRAAITRQGGGPPFTHWSLRKLADYLGDEPDPRGRRQRERVRQMLHAHGISFPADPDLERVHRPGRRGQAGPDRRGARHGGLTGVRVRPVRAVDIRPATAPAGPAASIRTGCPPRITAPTGSGTSTAATTSPRTDCGASPAYTRAARTPWPRCKSIRQARPDGRPDLRDPGQPVRRTRLPRSGPGPPPTRSSCASHQPTPRGPIRWRHSSGRCDRS